MGGRVAKLQTELRRARARNAEQEEIIEAQQLLSRQQRLPDLMSNVALLAIGAMTTSTLLPPAFISKVAPIVSKAPTALAMLGVWRVAQRSLGKVAGAALSKVRSILPDPSVLMPESAGKEQPRP